MNKLGFHLIGKPNEDFESCSDCIHAGDSEEICILRKCVHAIRYLYDCYEKAEQKTGKWAYKTTDAYIQRTCSACGWSERMYHRNHNQDGLIRNYCPHCGAKIEGVNDAKY